ncbi:MAG: glycosyltransferase family 39 protein [Elusimicrobiota bacterium]|nr:MAG: glycosyltransferase family 39 protein [Elusimicrobiota bacterium]
MNVLSAAAGAAACALLFAVARRRFGALPGAVAAAALALNPVFWAVSQVSEMYSLWVLSAVAVIAAAERAAEEPRLWPFFCFLCGVLLGNRLDLILLAPGLLWLALSRRPAARGEDAWWLAAAALGAPAAAALSGSNWPAAALILFTFFLRSRGEGGARRAGVALAAGLAGLSVYLYLPVRSATGPWLDWNRPAELSNFLDSILRTRYGGTLDLVSRGYATGELFADNLRLWGAHLWDALGPLAALAVLGAAAEFRSDRRAFYGRFAAWWWAGPVFLFIANMPPNAHAAAIVEPHYLLSDAVLLFWLAGGAALLKNAEGPAWKPAAALACAFLWPLARNVPDRLQRRGDFAARDFARNALRAVPPGAALVARKDVQLYALWHETEAAGFRPDVRVVAQGLAGSPWYRAGWRRRDPDLLVARLAEPAGWTALGAGGRPVLATHDAEPPAGAAFRFASPSPDFLVRRGPRRTDAAADFFHRDLIEGEAAAFHRAADAAARAGRLAEARDAARAAAAASPDFPEPAAFLGYVEAASGRNGESDAAYAAAERLFAAKLELAARWRSAPALVEAVRSQAAEASAGRGVVLERLGDRAGAEAAYRRSLALRPLAQAHYGLAVLAWGTDRAAAAADLEAALRLDPGHEAARRALESLRRQPSSGSSPRRIR